MQFYTLFHVKEFVSNSLAHNDRINLQGFVNCFVNLSRSLACEGYTLIVLTNDIGQLSPFVQGRVEMVEIPCQLMVPTDIRFYSTHFKMDAFKWLGANADEYAVLVDSDVVCINSIPSVFLQVISQNLPCCYHITGQVAPAHGQATIVSDKQKVMAQSSIGTWYGGEFIAGDAAFFARLYNAIMPLWPTYCEFYPELHHQGDEMVLGCAIESMLKQGVPIVDVAGCDVIARHWSVQTMHEQLPLKAHQHCFLLHLPADKQYLAKDKTSDGRTFFLEYEEYCRRKKPVQTLGSCVVHHLNCVLSKTVGCLLKKMAWKNFTKKVDTTM